MTLPASAPARCRDCTALLARAGEPCMRCAQYSRAPATSYFGGGPPVQVVHQAVPVKSVGVALLLTFVWLGAGQLYADRVVAGALLVSVNFFLVFVSFTGVGLLVSVPVWLVAFGLAAVTAVNAVHEHNHAMYLWR